MTRSSVTTSRDKTANAATAAGDGMGLADAIIRHASSVAEGDERDATPYTINASITMAGGMSDFTVRDLLALIVWTRDFKLQEEEEGANGPNNNKRFVRDSDARAECDDILDDLRDEYRKRARLQVRRWLRDTSWERGMEIIEDSEGRLTTADPEDVVFAIRTQLSVAEEYLCPNGYIAVMVDILSEIKAVQERMESALDSDWEAMGVERLCSVVNDCAALSEECMDIFVVTNKEGVFPTFELKKSRDDVLRGYLSLAQQATSLVARSIMQDLREAILPNVFSSCWQDDNGGQVVSVCTATLHDYFGDLKIWLRRKYYCRTTRTCLVLVLQVYLEGAFSQPPKSMFGDAQTVSGILLKDRLNLVEFFGAKYLKEVGLGGKGMQKREDVEDAFEILRAMSTIIDKADAADVVDEVHILTRELGSPIGRAATLYLVQKSRRCSRKKLQSWKDELQVLCGADSVSKEMIQPRLECDLSHLLTEPTKLEKLERVSGVYYLPDIIHAQTSSARRRVSEYGIGLRDTATPLVSLINRSSVKPKAKENGGKSVEPDESQETAKNKVGHVSSSGGRKVSIKALVEAEMMLQKLLPVVSLDADLTSTEKPAVGSRIEEKTDPKSSAHKDTKIGAIPIIGAYFLK